MLRATLKSLLSRKLRLILSALAVVLGVMFVSGAFILTDTVGRSFTGLFSDIYEYTDIQADKPSDVPGLTGQPVPEPFPAADVQKVTAVPGVSRAVGTVFVDNARVLNKNGRPVATTGSPRFGANWIGETELIKLREGRGPTGPNEIVLSANLAKTTGYAPGDTVPVMTALKPEKTPYTVVGIAGYPSGRDSLAGETIVFFHEPTAQEVLLGGPGLYSAIDIRVTAGADRAAVRDAVKAALGPDFNVKTGEELAAESSAGLEEGLGFFNTVLLAFAAVALLVAVFLILNTFSIIVAQRTRELALFRAMGASRGQVIWSVLVEALVIGLFAAIVGLVLGIGVGYGLGSLLGGVLSGGELELAGLSVPATSVIAAFGVGVGVTMVAALLPAFRAARIPPVAAMRDAATPDRPLTRLTLAGLVVLALGGTAFGLGLTGNLGDYNGWGLLGGTLACFVGVALLTPVISRPVVSILGRVFGRRASGQLGRRNSARNPRRTAITAAAVMVGIALITGISVVFSSLRASTIEAVDAGVNADLIIASDGFAALATFDPKAMDAIRTQPGVTGAVAIYADAAQIDGEQAFVAAADDLPTAVRVFEMGTVAGTVSSLSPGNVLVDDDTARAKGLSVGDSITVKLARATQRQYTIGGIYTGSQMLNGGFYFGIDDVRAGFTMAAPLQGYVELAPGTDTAAARTAVENALRDSPEVAVATVDDFIAQQLQVFDIVLVFVQLLLGLAMVIAVFGVINTLALSMIERTRELGMLRAVGMRRGQVMWMVTVESVVICVFGALLGVAVGVGLGVAVVEALRDDGFSELAFPWPLMGWYLIASVFVGLAAALVPAIRAARQNVLAAIAYE
jgi:putative ABC transport system permease protein